MTLPRMSHSRYDDFASCGEKYRLKRIEKVPTSPGIYRVAGTAFHEWTDMFDTSPPWDTEVPHEEWYVQRMDELIAEDEEKSGFPFQEWDNPDLTTLGKWRADQAKVAATGSPPKVAHPNMKALDEFRSKVGPDMIRKYIDWRAQSAWRIATINGEPCIELKLTFTIQGVEHVVVIDRVFERPEEGDLIVVDTKTWSKRRVTAQLPTYLVAVRQVASNVGGATYYEARRGTITEIKTHKYWDEDRLAALYVQAAHMISEEWFLPRPSGDCGMCDVKRHCRYYLD